MNAAELENEIAVKRGAYEALRERIHRQYFGQYAAMAGGKIVATGPSYDEALSAMQRLGPVPDCSSMSRSQG